jgi:hypothetical protein
MGIVIVYVPLAALVASAQVRTCPAIGLHESRPGVPEPPKVGRPVVLKPAGNVSTMLAAAVVGPLVTVAVTTQLNVPPEGTVLFAVLLLLKRSMFGWEHEVTVMASAALLMVFVPPPPETVAVLV